MLWLCARPPLSPYFRATHKDLYSHYTETQHLLLWLKHTTVVMSGKVCVMALAPFSVYFWLIFSVILPISPPMSFVYL